MKKYLTTLCKALRELMNLTEYDIRMSFEDNPPEAVTGENAGMTIFIDEVYLRIDIDIYPVIKDLWKRKDYDAIIECLVHEFSHTILNPIVELSAESIHPVLKKTFQETYERQTQRLTRILLKLLPKSYHYNPKEHDKTRTRTKTTRPRTNNRRTTKKRK